MCADITKCKGEGCPLKDNCYRYTAPADRFQSYFVEVPYDPVEQECKHQWEVDHAFTAKKGKKTMRRKSSIEILADEWNLDEEGKKRLKKWEDVSKEERRKKDEK